MVAKTGLTEECGSELSVDFVSPTPVGFHSYQHPHSKVCWDQGKGGDASAGLCIGLLYIIDRSSMYMYLLLNCILVSYYRCAIIASAYSHHTCISSVLPEGQVQGGQVVTQADSEEVIDNACMVDQWGDEALCLPRLLL